MSKKLLLVGGGGHCKSVLDTVLNSKQYTDVGIIDMNEPIGSTMFGVPIIGRDSDLTSLFDEGYQYAFVTIGSVGNPALRIKLYNLLEEIGFQIPTIFDHSAEISNHVIIESGVFIGKNAIVNAGTLIKKGAIVNTGSIIEHDCRIESFVHIAPGAVLSGAVSIGKSTHIGSNSTIKQQVSIGSNSIIGIGSIVLNNLSSHVVAYGNPCKEIRSL